MKKIIFTATILALGLVAYTPFAQADSYNRLDVYAQNESGRLDPARQSIGPDGLQSTIRGDLFRGNRQSLQDLYDRQERDRSQW